MTQTSDRPPVDEDAERLAETGLLTERQATAYLLRDVEDVPRDAAGSQMGVSVNVLDKHLRSARDKVSAAADTLDELERIRSERTP